MTVFSHTFQLLINCQEKHVSIQKIFQWWRLYSIRIWFIHKCFYHKIKVLHWCITLTSFKSPSRFIFLWRNVIMATLTFPYSFCFLLFCIIKVPSRFAEVSRMEKFFSFIENVLLFKQFYVDWGFFLIIFSLVFFG